MGRRLFGRDRESRQLIEAFARVRDGHGGEVALIRGPAGIGKSSLAKVLESPLDETPHLFATGKCLWSGQQAPLRPFAEILGAIIETALVSDEARLTVLRELVMDSVQGSEALLGHLVPELFHMIGYGWRNPDLPAKLAQNRIAEAMIAALTAFLRDQRAAVIVVDDLQWGDDLTFQVLDRLAAALPANLLLVLAFREGEDADERIAPLVETLREHVVDLPLGPIDRDQVGDLVGARLPGAEADIGWLSDILNEASGGNPFSILQRLRLLDEEGMLLPPPGNRHWRHDRKRIRLAVDRESEQAIVQRRLGNLCPARQHLLGVLALLGAACPPALLADLVEIDETHLLGELAALCGMELVRRTDAGFAIFHDRVLDAAIEGMGRAGRVRLQVMLAVGLGRHRARLSADWHCRAALLAREAVLSGETVREDEAGAIATLLVETGRMLRGQGAVEQAADLVGAFRLVLAAKPDALPYGVRYDGLCLDLELLLARGLVDLACVRVHDLEELAQTVPHRARALYWRARVQAVRSDYDGAIEAALAGLSLLGRTVPRHPDKDLCRALRQRLDTRLAAFDPTALADLPLCVDEDALLVSQLLSALLPALFDSEDLRFLHLALIVEFTLDHGVSPASPYGLSWYGVMLAHHFDRYAQGLALGLAALALIDRHGFEASRTETLVAIDQLSPWTEPPQACLGWINRAIRSGNASGDLGMTCYARNHFVSDLLFAGAPLDQVEAEAQSGLALTRMIAFSDIEQLIAAQRDFVRLVRYGEPFPPMDRLARSPVTRYWLHLSRGMGHYLAGDAQAALREFEALAPEEWAVPAHIDISQSTLFTALSLARMPDRDAAIAAMVPHLDRLRGWASINPGTFLVRLHLVEGEMARLSGRPREAITAFDAALTHAGSFTGLRALAHELASRLCAEEGLAPTAMLHHAAAIEHYERWGATAKARSLGERGLGRTLRVNGVPLAHIVGDEMAVRARGWMGEPDLGAIRREVLKFAASLCDAASARLIRLEEGGFRVVAHWDGDGFRENGAVSLDAERPCALAAAQLAAISASGTVALGLSPPWLLCIPLTRGGDLVGAVQVEGHGLREALLASQLRTLDLFASLAEMALRNGMLRQRLDEESARLGDMQDALRAARVELARNSQWTALGEFTAALAHEINQPLSSIALHAAAARRWIDRESPDLDETRHAIRGISTAADRAAEIVRALKMLTRQDGPDMAPLALDHLVETTCDMMGPQIRQHETRLEVQLDPADPMILGDGVQLRQVLANLMGNALDALDQMPVGDRLLQIAVGTTGDKAFLRVRDNGPGIPDHLGKTIFLPMVTSKTRGMGMGLVICKSIISAHKGHIRLQENEGTGTTFLCEFPLLPAPSGKVEA